MGRRAKPETKPETPTGTSGAAAGAAASTTDPKDPDGNQAQADGFENPCISVKSRANQFWRAGYCFNNQVETIMLPGSLTQEAFQAIVDEPQLIVRPHDPNADPEPGETED